MFFAGKTLIGSITEDIGGAAYFSGFIARKLYQYHMKLLKLRYGDCCCIDICGPQDLGLHLFVQFKQYNHIVDPSQGLKYCTEDFLNCILKCERIFLYCFHEHSHRNGFDRIVQKAISEHITLPSFCSPIITEYFIKYFIKCRIFQSLKYFNSKLVTKNDREKVKKMMNE